MKPTLKVLGTIALLAASCAKLSTASAVAQKCSTTSLGTAIHKILFGIVNGQVTDQYPSVGLIATVSGGSISALCSGTFVGSNTLLSASHCLLSTDPGAIAYFPTAKLPSDATFGDLQTLLPCAIHPQAVLALAPNLMGHATGESISASDTATDLSLLIFRDNLAPATSAIRTQPTAAGASVVMVGFGVTNISMEQSQTPTSPTDALLKRVGSNTIPTVPAGYPTGAGSIILVGKSQDSGSGGSNRALVSHGDSGGPLFSAGLLIGTASSVGMVPSMYQATLGGDALANFVDLSNAAAHAFLSGASAQGAQVAFAPTAP